MVLFDRPYGNIEYDESVPAIIAHFYGHLSSSQFREFLDVGADILAEKYQEKKREVVWIANTKYYTVQPNEDTQWASEFWNPKVYKNGLRHLGIVIPEKVFGLATVENYTRFNYMRKADVLDVMMFKELENAKAWYRRVLHENYIKQQK